MRLLILSPLFPPAVGGAASYFSDILPAVTRREDVQHVTLLTEAMPGQPSRIQLGKLDVLRLLPTRVSLPRRPFPIHALSYVRTQVWFSKQLPQLVDQLQPDLLHFHTRFRGTLFYRAVGQLGVPVLADLRDKLSDPRRLASTADRLLCCAEGIQQFAIAGGFPEARIDLVPVTLRHSRALNPRALRQVLRKYDLCDVQYILFVGDITPNKGVYELLAAHDQWRKEHQDVKLVFCGINREGRRFSSSLSGRDSVIYLGHLPHQEVIALLQAAEVLVLPSRSEGLPTVVLEAVALNTKVVCPPGVPEFLTHMPDFVLPSVEISAIRDTIDAVWSSPARPRYPLDHHRAEYVVDELMRVYGRFDLCAGRSLTQK